jgi:hypothetical protein
MRAQGYDGRTSMSGIHRGVLVMIMERIPTAQCVYCKAHVLKEIEISCTVAIMVLTDTSDDECAIV